MKREPLYFWWAAPRGAKVSHSFMGSLQLCTGGFATFDVSKPLAKRVLRPKCKTCLRILSSAIIAKPNVGGFA